MGDPESSSEGALLLFARPGAILRADMVEWCQTHLAALESVDIGPGRHFVQEDRPHEIGRALRGWYERIGQGEMG